MTDERFKELCKLKGLNVENSFFTDVRNYEGLYKIDALDRIYCTKNDDVIRIKVRKDSRGNKYCYLIDNVKRKLSFRGIKFHSYCSLKAKKNEKV